MNRTEEPIHHSTRARLALAMSVLELVQLYYTFTGYWTAPEKERWRDLCIQIFGEDRQYPFSTDTLKAAIRLALGLGPDEPVGKPHKRP